MKALPDRPATMIATIEHAEFAQDQHADEIDDIFLGAELTKIEKALLRDDGADHESDQQNDRNGLPAHPFEMMDGVAHARRLRQFGEAVELRKG